MMFYKLKLNSFCVLVYEKKIGFFYTRASLIPVNFVLGRSNTRNAARLAVYEATIIIAKPAQTIPSTRAEKLRGVPSHQNIYYNFLFTFPSVSCLFQSALIQSLH